MRLINTTTLELEEFIGRPPRYAILSHTWGPEEVSLQDFHDIAMRRYKRGFRKIEYTCEQAITDGLQYIWVDTCCIDKISSAELSEAINSMFKWYKMSERCYAYLEDVEDHVILSAREKALAIGHSDTSGPPPVWHESASHSRWFTRGWTLQELIAPDSVTFYSRGWIFIGSKGQLASPLHHASGIDENILLGASLHSVCIGRRMRWAAHRETTREEDMAYSLIGLFNVNMPMLYGEGSKAFLRLQEEIIREWDDHTIFAWRADPYAEDFSTVRGVFATSPREFAHFDGIEPFTDLSMDESRNSHLTSTNKGIMLTANVLEEYRYEGGAQVERALLALNCKAEGTSNQDLGIRLARRGGREYVRVNPEALLRFRSNGLPKKIYIAKHTTDIDRVDQPRPDRQHAFYVEHLSSRVTIESVQPSDSAAYYPEDRQIVLRSGYVPKSFERAALILSIAGEKCACPLFGLRLAPDGKFVGEFELFPRAELDAMLKQAGGLANAALVRFDSSVTKRVASVSYGHILAVSVIPRTVRGVDMFVISITLS